MAYLIIKCGPRRVDDVPVRKGNLSIGRLPANDVVVPDSTVSGHHARVWVENGQYFVQDMSSLNGTFVNDQRIRKALIREGDEITIGRHTLVFHNDPAEYPPMAELTQQIVTSADDIGVSSIKNRA